jgi:hypothetical protein
MSKSKLRVRKLIVTDSLILAPNASIIKRSNNDYKESKIPDLDILFGESDTPNATLNVSSGVIAEAAGTSIITATLDKVADKDVVVSLAYSGTAVSGTDYVAPASSITIPKGQLTGSTTLTSAADANLEAGETVVVDITGVRLRETTQRKVVTISDAEVVLVTLSVDTNTISEPSDVSVITATLDQSTFEDVVVSLAYTGTATKGVDYTASSSTITVPAGQTTATANVTALADSLVEGNETIIVNISNVAGGGAIESGTQYEVITVTDDNPVVTLSTTADNIAENGGVSTVTATLDKVASDDVIVTLGFTGTATKDTDYSVSSSTITITQGNLTGTATLTGTTDGDLEPHESIIVDITDVSGANASESGTQQKTVVIVDDDGPAVVTLGVDSFNIAEAAAVSTITASLSKTTYEDVIVDLGFTGSAVKDTDYTASATSITISQGNLTGTATVTATQDADVEANETIIIDITNVTGGSANEKDTQKQTVTITDDDAAVVTLSVDTSTIAEPAQVSTITATLDKATYQDVVVDLGFTGTAIEGQDYAISASSITITQGNVTGTATVTATDDADVEANETIIVDITGVTGGTASESGTQQETITLTDDDAALVTLSVSNATISEPSGTSLVTATLDKATYEDVVVNLVYSGTAVSGVDYATPASSVTISKGQLSASTAVTANEDALTESDETIIVDISSVNGGNASESGTQQKTITLQDDSGENAWIAANFATGVTNYTGAYTSRTTVTAPALVKDATGTNGKYAFDLKENTGNADKRIAMMNVSISNLTSGDAYGAGVRAGANVELFMSNVTVDPGWPAWVNYSTTNYDGVDLDGSGNKIYAEDLTITNWNADGGIDVKSSRAEFVNLTISGAGHRVLRIWRPGPHYLVDSSLSSSQGSDLIWISSAAAGGTLYVYNCTFDGAPTCPTNRIDREGGSNLSIVYLNTDPRLTGDMHEMFN